MLDYNFEFVYQFGEFGSGNISAWTAASDTGYTFKATPWQPRVGIKLNIASGDENKSDKNLNTFNPLFPRGSYFAENGLNGPANFIDIDSSLTFKPFQQISFTVGDDILWRESTQDAVYRQPNIAIAGTAGKNKSYTGNQVYFLTTWKPDPHIEITATYVHFAAGDVIKDAGGSDSDYVGSWLSYRF